MHGLQSLNPGIKKKRRLVQVKVLLCPMKSETLLHAVLRGETFSGLYQNSKVKTLADRFHFQKRPSKGSKHGSHGQADERHPDVYCFVLPE